MLLYVTAVGPAGVAAAAAIASFKKKRKPHSFETNPAIRKRQQTRLLRKIRNCIEEYTIRVGQQAAFLAVTPAKGRDSNNSYKVFGSQPLESVVSINYVSVTIFQCLETNTRPSIVFLTLENKLVYYFIAFFVHHL